MGMRTVRFIDTASCFLRNRKGVASVEFVLILPVLILCLFGTIEIGRVLHDYHVVVKGVRDGTRYLSRVAVDCSGGVGTVGSIVNAPDNHEQWAKNLTMTGSISLTPTLPDDYLLAAWAPPSTLTVTVDCNDPATLEGIYSGNPVVPSVTMTAVVKFDFIGSLPILPSTIDFTVSHKEISIVE